MKWLIVAQQISCLYDTLKDPENSDPAEIQEEFGHSFFGIGDDGVIDIEAEFAAIAQKVTEDGTASLATFWDIEKVFIQLRDGHINPPDVESAFPNYLYAAAPGRFTGIQELIVQISPEYSFDEDGELQLTLTYTFLDAETLDIRSSEVRQVASINGMTVAQFARDLMSNPDMPSPLPTLGARINQLVQEGFIFGGFSPFVANPAAILPDLFTITYTDGDSDVFVSMVLPSLLVQLGVARQTGADGLPYIVFDRALALEYINQPGEQYDAYARSIALLPEEFGRPARRLKKNSAGQHQKRRLEDSEEDDEPDDGNGDEAPREYEIRAFGDDVMVLKIEGFSDDVEVYLDFWSEVLQMANEGQYTKLIIDMSKNGGGAVDMERAVAMALFPEVALQWFVDQDEITWNGSMEAWLDSGLALINLLDVEFRTLTVGVRYLMKC